MFEDIIRQNISKDFVLWVVFVEHFGLLLWAVLSNIKRSRLLAAK